MNAPDKSFQRIGAASNAQVGNAFEISAQRFFQSTGLPLSRNIEIPVGVGEHKKNRSFDLGCTTKKIIVECKSHKWTAGENVPSAKLTVWNESMFYFLIAPKEFRKIMFVLRDFSEKRNQTLAEYYLRINLHLIPDEVEFWEYDEEKSSAVQCEFRS